MSSNQSIELDPFDFCNEIKEVERDFKRKNADNGEEDSAERERERIKELKEAAEDDQKFIDYVAICKRKTEETNEKSANERQDLLKCKNRFEHKYLLKYAEKGDEQRVRKCLDIFPHSIEAVDADGYTALHRACHNPNTELVKLLISRGANAEAQTVEGWRPIHCAAYWGNVTVVHLLICYGVNLNARTTGNNTCLHLAAQRGDRRLLECLVYNPDIDLTVKNNQGDTAYSIAKRNHPYYQLWHNVSLQTPLRELDLN